MKAISNKTYQQFNAADRVAHYLGMLAAERYAVAGQTRASWEAPENQNPYPADTEAHEIWVMGWNKYFGDSQKVNRALDSANKNDERT